jgi:hypothetical protein
MCARYALPNGSLGLLLDDDLAMATWLQRFLADHRVPYDLPERDRHGRDLFADPGSLHQQARRLIHAVGRGRDNELFVLLGDFSRRHESLGELLRAVRVARARHHQVLVVQPGAAPADPGPRPTNGRPRDLLDYSARSAAWRAWTDTRRAFGRLGATTLAADAGDPVRLILRRLEQMRNLQAAGRT